MVNNQQEASVSFTQDELKYLQISLAKLVQAGGLGLGDLPIIYSANRKLSEVIIRDDEIKGTDTMSVDSINKKN